MLAKELRVKHPGFDIISKNLVKVEIGMKHFVHDYLLNSFVSVTKLVLRICRVSVFLYFLLFSFYLLRHFPAVFRSNAVRRFAC